MRRPARTPVMLTLVGVMASVLTVLSPGTASAAESVPTLKWTPPATISSYNSDIVTSPTGSVTLPCTTSGDGLKQYNASGQLVQNISRTTTIDGITNCIQDPALDKNGDTYGVPYGKDSSNAWSFGPNLLAYNGNTLKWKYPVYCRYDTAPAVAAGADGNIYVATYGHLIGLKPNLAAGQTQPDKVLDVTIPNDCSIKLFPYKDGIMLHGNLTSGARFYSYAGKSLGTTPGLLNVEKLSANGRLFTYSTVSGSYTSISLSAYDPRTGQTAWTTSASTAGADTSGGPTLYPMADGGVAAIITEQKMISGIPASPTQWVQTLVVLNASGQKIRSVELPTTYSNGTQQATFDSGINVVADNTGKLAVVRGLTFSAPAARPGISIKVYDSITGTWPYQQVMTGDFTKSGGASGYLLNYSANSVGISSNAVYLSATCTNNCTDYNTRLYAFQATGLGKDYPKADVLNASTPTQPVPVPYVALGDSFSSGEGVSPFDPDTDNSGYDMCHRSYLAYSVMISKTPSSKADLNQGGFWACSGSQTSDILNSQGANNVKNHESAQLSHLNSSTKVVTLTIGGNDIGFGDFAAACVTSWCDSTTTIYATTMGKIQQDLPFQLKDTYEHILAAAGTANVYVMDYPYVVGVKNTTDPQDVRCPYLFDGATAWADAQAARQVITSINSTISTAVTSVRQESTDYGTRLHYVPVNGSGSPFAGHGLCDSGSSYFMNVDNITTGNKVYVFHPNGDGQGAYAQLMTAATG